MLLTLSCTLALPLCHASAFVAESAISRSLLAALCYPINGGPRHAVFQSLAAVAWVASLVCSALAPAHTASLHRVAVALSVLSLVFCTKGHLTHRTLLRRASQHLRRHLVVVVGLCAAVLALTGTYLLLLEASTALPSLQPPPAHGFANDETCSVRLKGSWQQWQVSAAHTGVALVLLLAAATSAHGVAGHVLHGGGQRRAGGWHFFQPFKGGAVFIATQSLSWSLFVAAVLSAVYTARSIASGLLHLSPPLLAALALSAAIAPVGLSTSALAFVDGAAPKRIASYACGLRRGLRSASADALVATAASNRSSFDSVASAAEPQLDCVHNDAYRDSSHPQHEPSTSPYTSRPCPEQAEVNSCPASPHVGAEELRGVRASRAVLQTLSRAACMCYAFLPGHLAFSMLVLPYFFIPASTAASFALGHAALCCVYYAVTLRGDPAVTGSREWPAVIAWLQAHLQPALAAWMGRCEVHKAFEGDLDPEQRYIFGYLPHGLYPAGAGYVTHLSSWRAAFPGISPRVLCANVMHYVPVIRDFGAWIGFRQVTRASFARALREKGHVLMSPGGQRELLYAAEARPQPLRPQRPVPGNGSADCTACDVLCSRPVVRVCVQHKGFCRMALEHDAALLPVLCFGELLQLRNAVTWPWLQRHSYRWIGFPLPYLALGHWGTPLPRRVPAVFVVGPPVRPAPRTAGQAVAQESVDDLHRRFYESVRALWDENKHRHGGYENHVLEFDGEL